MKIILIGPAFPYRGGIANFNESLCQALIKAGHQAEIVTFKFQYPSFLFPGKTQKTTDQPSIELKTKRLVNSIGPLSWLRTAIYINKQDADLVIFQHWLPIMSLAMGSIARMIRKKETIKLAITHNIVPHEGNPLDRFLTRYFVKSNNGFVCLSKEVYDDLGHFTQNPNKILAFHPIYEIFGYEVSKEIARKHLQLPENKKILLFFGLIRKYKGLELLIRAMALENCKKHDVFLVVAGEFYENKKIYTDLIENLGLANQIRLMDQFVSNEEVKFYFGACDLVVQPYLSASQSGVTQVAYHFGKPMLVTNVGGLPEIVDHEKTGYVVEVSEYAIAEAIDNYYTNNRESEMSKNVIKEKHRFSWEKFVDDVISAYRKSG